MVGTMNFVAVVDHKQVVALVDTVLGEMHPLNDCSVLFPQDNLKKNKDRLEDQFLWFWLVAVLSAPQ